jgi:hypothetical protein
MDRWTVTIDNNCIFAVSLEQQFKRRLTVHQLPRSFSVSR